MSKYPWEVNGKPANPIELQHHDEQPKHDPFAFVRIRIQHGEGVRFVGIRAEDSDPTGRILLSDGSVITLRAWGVPTTGEPFFTSKDLMQEIIGYVQSKGLTVKNPS